MTSWLDASEIVTGLILEKRLSLNSVRPDLFFGEYKNLIKYMKEGIIEPEDLIQKVGLDPFQSAVEASKHLNGAGDMADWTRILEESALGYEAGAKLEKMARKWQLGESPDWTGAKEIITKGEGNISTGYVPLSTIESGEVKFIKSGWPPFDTHIGGLPEAGLIVEGGNPGVGKTTSMIKFASCFAKEHPDKVVAVSSIEMLLMEVSGRFREIAKLPKDVEDRILIDDTPVTAEQAINNASRIDNLGLLIIDFADLMIRGETTESSMAHIYRTLMIGAKQLHIPIILLSQLSYKYQGGLPHPDHLRYTSLAKALAWMIIMLYNPSSDFYEEDSSASDLLPIVEDKAYMIVWKVRGGFRKHLNESPGAIQIAFRGDKGWGNATSERSWYSLKKFG
jgi:hypothetical protein